MARALSKKSFYPHSGDMLENTAEGVTWTYVRANTFQSSTGVKVRYGLLEGKVAGEETSAVWAITDQDSKSWLDGVEFIHRKEGETFRRYGYSKETETWREV